MFCELSLCGVLSALAEWKLCKAIPASAEHQRHECGRKGSGAVHEQIADRVGHSVLADKEPLEDLLVRANGDAQREHRASERDSSPLGSSVFTLGVTVGAY